MFLCDIFLFLFLTSQYYLLVYLCNMHVFSRITLPREWYVNYLKTFIFIICNPLENSLKIFLRRTFIIVCRT